MTFGYRHEFAKFAPLVLSHGLQREVDQDDAR